MATISKSTHLLKGLPEDLISKLFEGASRGRAAAGTVLFSEGDEGDGIYIVDKGLLKIVIKSPIGEKRIVAILGPGSIVGELATIDGLPRSASAVVMQECEFRFVTRQAFATFTAMQPGFFRDLVKILSMRLREADEELAASTFLSSRGRLARTLIELAEQFGQASGGGGIVIEPEMTTADLAAMAGLGREGVTQLLTEWQQRRLVTQSGQQQHIHDMVALKREVRL